MHLLCGHVLLIRNVLLLILLLRLKFFVTLQRGDALRQAGGLDPSFLLGLLVLQRRVKSSQMTCPEQK
jgi:hypothetical protein